MSSFVKVVRKNRRRITEDILQHLGKSEASDDSYYQNQSLRYYELISNLRGVIHHMNDYRGQLIGYSKVCSKLSVQVLSMVNSINIGKDVDAEVFANGLHTIATENELKNGYHTADQTIEAAIHSIEKKIIAMESVNVLVQKRERLKLDFDGYLRKYESLKASTTVSEHKLNVKEEHLNVARAALETTTLEIYKIFALYEVQRDSLISPELELFQRTLVDFFSRGLDAVDFKLRHVMTDNGNIQTRADKIYDRMKARATFADLYITSDERQKIKLKTYAVSTQDEPSKSAPKLPMPMLRPPIPTCPAPVIFKKSITLITPNRQVKDIAEIAKTQSYNNQKRSSVSEVKDYYQELDEYNKQASIRAQTTTSEYDAEEMQISDSAISFSDPFDEQVHPPVENETLAV